VLLLMLEGLVIVAALFSDEKQKLFSLHLGI